MAPEKILIIDDEQAICDGCRIILEDQGHWVDFRKDGKSGLEAVRTGSYDAVLLDMKLPGADGMEILETARKVHPDLCIIVMTGFSSISNAVNAMKAGAVDYLAKPFSDEALVLAVDSALKRKRLVLENRFLRQELLDLAGMDNIVGENPALLKLFEQIQRVAPTDSTVLICGESGTGKELFARAIHAHSRRSARKFVAMDCSTLSHSLLESELFGHVKGSFTGATHDRAGIFQIADSGTLFLDDVTNLEVETQGKLLRVLETHEYKPVGASDFKTADARIIAATNKNLQDMVDRGTFREDLFYRLNVFPLHLPPLRERRDDIPKLAYHFLHHFCRKTGKRISGFSDDALEVLVNHEWPGNVRQLKNVIERLVIVTDSGVLKNLDLMDPPQGADRSPGEASTPETLEEPRAAKQRIIETAYGQKEKAGRA